MVYQTFGTPVRVRHQTLGYLSHFEAATSVVHFSIQRLHVLLLFMQLLIHPRLEVLLTKHAHTISRLTLLCKPYEPHANIQCQLWYPLNQGNAYHEHIGKKVPVQQLLYNSSCSQSASQGYFSTFDQPLVTRNHSRMRLLSLVSLLLVDDQSVFEENSMS